MVVIIDHSFTPNTVKENNRDGLAEGRGHDPHTRQGTLGFRDRTEPRSVDPPFIKIFKMVSPARF